MRGRQDLFEKLAVDVRKIGELFVEIGEPLVFRRVQHLKQFLQTPREIAAVLARSLFDQVLKLLLIKDRRVLGKEAKQDADQIDFEFVVAVTDLFEPVVEPAHQLGGLDIRGVLLFVDLFLIAEE